MVPRIIFKTLGYLFSLCPHAVTHHLPITRIPSIVCNVDFSLFMYNTCCFNNFVYFTNRPCGSLNLSSNYLILKHASTCFGIRQKSDQLWASFFTSVVINKNGDTSLSTYLGQRLNTDHLDWSFDNPLISMIITPNSLMRKLVSGGLR